MGVSKFGITENSENGATIILTNPSEEAFGAPIPRRNASYGSPAHNNDETDSPNGITFGNATISRKQPAPEQNTPNQGTLFQDTPVPAFGLPASFLDPTVPKPIRDMLALYHHGTGSQQERAQNFVTQAQFMANYTDDVPWQSNFMRFLPTYHDLNVTQLRGYFSWRTHIRNGEAVHAPLSFAYLHIYELLNGVGAANAEDTLKKIKLVASLCKESGIADAQFDANISNWLLCFAVLHNVPVERAQQYIEPTILANDQALITLQNPEQYSDAEVCDALKFFANEQFCTSPAFAKNNDESQRLFAAIWRFANANYSEAGSTLFTHIFNKAQEYMWYPLHNAMYVEELSHENTTYQLTECRSFTYSDGTWKQSKFNKLYFRLKVLHQLLHEADRQVRSKVKSGHYLRFKSDEVWARERVEGAFAHLEQVQREASQVWVQLDVRHLNEIRADAASTRESLLTEEEKGEQAKPLFAQESLGYEGSSVPAESSIAETVETSETNEISNISESLENKQNQQATDSRDSHETAVLRILVRGESVSDYLREHHLMASVVADTLNEAYCDEIGDSIVESDGSELVLVEDYVEDVTQLVQ